MRGHTKEEVDRALERFNVTKRNDLPCEDTALHIPNPKELPVQTRRVQQQRNVTQSNGNQSASTPEPAQTPTGTKSEEKYQPNLWDSSLPSAHPPATLKPCGQRVRRTRIHEQCTRLREAGVPIADLRKLDEDRTFRSMLVDEKHKTVYCEVPKAACTSWKTFLANITGKVKPEDQSRLYQLVHDTTYHPKIGFRFLDSYTPNERKYILRTYFKFLVVRNPYTRFLSAYDNKFRSQGPQSEWYHKTMGKYILRRYRKANQSTTDFTGSEVTFTDLTRMISNPYEDNPHRYDGHFWKQQSSCFPCLVDYDYIAKVETMTHDADILIREIAPTVDIHLPYLNKNKNTVHERDYVRNAYKTISDADLKALSAVFAEDMEVFGYEFDGERNINCNSGAKGQPQCC